MTMCNLMELIIMTLMKFNNYDDMKFVKFDDNDVKFLIIFLFLYIGSYGTVYAAY